MSRLVLYNCNKICVAKVEIESMYSVMFVLTAYFSAFYCSPNTMPKSLQTSLNMLILYSAAKSTARVK